MAAKRYKAATGVSKVYAIYLAVPGSDVPRDYGVPQSNFHRANWHTGYDNPNCPTTSSPEGGLWSVYLEHYLVPALEYLEFNAPSNEIISFGGVLASLGNNMAASDLATISRFTIDATSLIDEIKATVQLYSLAPVSSIATVGCLSHLPFVPGLPPVFALAQESRDEQIDWLITPPAGSDPRAAVDYMDLVTLGYAFSDAVHPSSPGHRYLGREFAKELHTLNLAHPGTVFELR